MTGFVIRSCGSSEFGAVMGLVAEHTFRWFHSADQSFGNWTVVRFAAGQQNGDQAPLSIWECVDLRATPSARTAHSPLFLPLFRRVPMVRFYTHGIDRLRVGGIARSWPTPGTDFPTSGPKARSGYRSSLGGPYSSGQPHQRRPLLRTCTIPLMTRRSPPRATLQKSVG